MRLTTSEELLDLRFKLRDKIPENLVIVSPEILDESFKFMDIDPEEAKRFSNIKIHGFRVVRDFAEITT